MNGGTVHSLGMTAAVGPAALAVIVAVVEARRESGGVRRLRGALGVRPERRRPSGGRSGRPGGPGVRWPGRGRAPGALARGGGPLREWGPVVIAGLGVAWLVGGLLGAVAGAGTALGVRRWLAGRQEAAEGSAAEGEPDPAELPLCADLMAACLAAGATPGQAAGAVGRCLGGSLGTALIRVQAELRLGADPVECWERFGRLPAAREMGRCLSRASTTGSAPVAEMSRLAADYRAAHGRLALARARKAAVLATAPLGVCFLPAFLLVGVAPVVMGLAGTVLGGGAD